MASVIGAAVFPELYVRRQGSGPALLLLPGLGSTVTEFRAVMPALAHHFDVLAADLPGQGWSPALPEAIGPDVAALTDAVERELDRRNVAVPHVLGVSLGGRIGLELARRQRARSVVAVAPTGPVTPLERIYQVALLGWARLGFQAMAPAADHLLRPIALRAAALGLLRAQGWHTPSREAAELVHAFAEAEDFWRLLRHAVLPDGSDHTEVACPVHIAQGTHDVLSLSQGTGLAARVPGARFHVLPLAGHSAVGDVPAQVVRLVEEAAAEAGSS